MPADRPNVLLVSTDQQRFDAVGALGTDHVYTPNLDRLVESGVAFTNAYSQCPVCVPARYNLRTGCAMPTTGYWSNDPTPADDLEERTGPFLARAMGERGYRTFGVGKFHTFPYDLDLGYDVHHRRLEYDDFIESEHPEYAHVASTSGGEDDEMYYMPQRNPVPADLTFAAWATDRGVEELRADDDRPFFGVVSYMGPHAPHTPPEPFTDLYDPDEMPSPVVGDQDVDHMDEQIPWMNHLVWADEVDDLRARTLTARYYGEVAHIDQQVGRLLDALEDAGERENTVVVFVSDHGEHLGDHRAWQKESFFEASTRVPFLVSWPDTLPAGERCDDLVCLTDVFGIATRAAGDPEYREGVDVVGAVRGEAAPRERLFGYYEEPGSTEFKVMVREADWKYVWMANGGREQLFDVAADPDELDQRIDDEPAVAERLRAAAVDELRERGCEAALDGDALDASPYHRKERERLTYGDGFPEHPADVLED